jgi:hypothetical protein
MLFIAQIWLNCLMDDHHFNPIKNKLLKFLKIKNLGCVILDFES